MADSSAGHVVLILGIIVAILAAIMTTVNESRFDVIVIGGGSAGLTAALTAALAGCNVLVLEKQDSVGGNSAKASSGVSALSPGASKDDEALFVKDVLSSGGGLSDPLLVETLVHNSSQAIQFLSSLGVEFSDTLVQLGGHSVARTHTVVKGAVGWSIMSKLREAVDAHKRIMVKTRSSTKHLLMDHGKVTGCVYSDPDGYNHTLYASKGVILATGGFGANFTWISRYVDSPLYTTNGDFAMGDGILLGQDVGAQTKHLNQVQIHPTAFIDPENEDARSKILAPEKLRGFGGILVSHQGNRFVNELSTRLVVSSKILSLPEKSAFLVLDRHAEKSVGPAMDFYKAKHLFKTCAGVDELSEQLHIPRENLVQSLVDLDHSSELIYAKITPAVHYTMGGLAIDIHARVLNDSNNQIEHLYAAGEVSAGVHGANRLGGMSILECIVFGQIAGNSAASSP
jgi:flavocytochrome c